MLRLNAVSRITFVLLALAPLVVAGCTGTESGEAPTKVGPTTNSNAQELVEKQRLASLNLEYWNLFNDVKKRLEYTIAEGSQTGSDALQVGNRSASQIEGIPIKDVDSSLAQLANDTATLCRRWGQFVDNNYSAAAVASRFGQGFLDGLRLDLKAGTEADRKIEERRQQLLNETDELKARASKLRLELSTKYSLEFPRLHL